jgi:hypothetical protein
MSAVGIGIGRTDRKVFQVLSRIPLVGPPQRRYACSRRTDHLDGWNNSTAAPGFGAVASSLVPGHTVALVRPALRKTRATTSLASILVTSLQPDSDPCPGHCQTRTIAAMAKPLRCRLTPHVGVPREPRDTRALPSLRAL